MVLLCALLMALVVAPARADANEAGIDPTLAAALDQILAQTVASGRIPGAAMAVSVPGQGAWIGARGLADHEGGTALTPESLAAMQTFIATRGLDSPELTYGLGMMQTALPAVARGHTGALIGYRTALWYLPDTGVVIAVALNQLTADPTSVATRALDALHAHRVG
jgi:CubicO group peptidase (beta-lactamase class C family)